MARTGAPGAGCDGLDLSERPPARCRAASGMLAAALVGLAGTGQAAAAVCGEDVVAAAVPTNTTITAAAQIVADRPAVVMPMRWEVSMDGNASSFLAFQPVGNAPAP